MSIRAIRRTSAGGQANGPHSRSSSGQATTEFALVVTVLVFMMMGIVDFGRLVAMQSAAVTASREAARYGSAIGGTPKQFMDCTGIRSAAQRVIGGLLTLDPSNTTIWYDDGTGQSTWSSAHECGGSARDTEDKIDSFDRIAVRVDVSYEPISPIRALVGSIRVESIDRRMIVKAP